jgi:hypothetical protein
MIDGLTLHQVHLFPVTGIMNQVDLRFGDLPDLDLLHPCEAAALSERLMDPGDPLWLLRVRLGGRVVDVQLDVRGHADIVHVARTRERVLRRLFWWRGGSGVWVILECELQEVVGDG